ncbi:unnamed protein product [Symbiodinium natans]|uniref:Uncharacterized protein n=1 Tax=Symbiodinium natans TaxID=878477 RepID=A0A812N8B1_9DINO|nr:unnamed protein product [Symbiodinium natans]
MLRCGHMRSCSLSALLRWPPAAYRCLLQLMLMMLASGFPAPKSHMPFGFFAAVMILATGCFLLPSCLANELDMLASAEKKPDLLDVHIGTNIEDEELQPVLGGNLRGMRTRIQMTRSMPHVGALARSFMASLTCHHHCQRWLYRSLPDRISYRTSSRTRQDNRSSLNKRPPTSHAPRLAGGSPPPSPRPCP